MHIAGWKPCIMYGQQDLCHLLKYPMYSTNDIDIFYLIWSFTAESTLSLSVIVLCQASKLQM